MELYEMVYRRLKDSQRIAALTAVFDNGAAVFYQRAPSTENEKWGKYQYPRIDFTLDLQENPARNTSGTLMVSIWCDMQRGVEPEDIEPVIRELFHAAFAQTDDDVYCFAWVRSDAFEVKKQEEETPRTIGVTLVFDLTACPCQYTMYPDPIKGLNEWTKTILPDAVVIGEDTINGWLVPTRERPVIYWRLTDQGKARQYHTHTWLDIAVEGHVYCRNAADRLYNLVKLNTAHALIGHIPLEDTSPLFLKTFKMQPHMNYISTGQLRATGYFGILQPEAHFSNKATGYKLCRTNIPREIIDSDGAVIKIEGETEQHRIQYQQASMTAETGQNPQPANTGASSESSTRLSASGQGYTIHYERPRSDRYPTK